MKHLTPNFFTKNRQKIINSIPENSAAFVTSANEFPRNGDQSLKYRQNSDLFYLTGIDQADTLLLLNPSSPNEANKEILFVKKPDKSQEIWNGHILTNEEVTEISGVKNIQYISNFDSLIGRLIYDAEFIYININDNLSCKNFHLDAAYEFAEKMKKRFPLHSFRRLSPIITKNRLIKSKEEIEVIRESVRITSDALNRVLKFIKPNVVEYEIVAEITHEFIRQQAYEHAYHPIVAAGINNCVLHYCENNKICKSGDLVLMDFGAEFQNYAADLSRTVPVNGKFTNFQKKVYNAVLRVQNKAAELMKPNQTTNNWNKQVGEIMQNELLELGLISTRDVKEQSPNYPAYKKYFMHGTGHFMGLDVHDVGSNDTVWQAGMIMTNEPGIYIEEKGFGIRLENDILITENGNINLMENIPIEADEIEELMNSNR